MGTVWLRPRRAAGPAGGDQADAAPARGRRRTSSDQQRQRALREGRIAARLSHPHAISVYDVALDGGQPWLVMEYLPSRSLAQVLFEDGVLRADQVAQIGAQVADALAATHAAGIVHRDVKPANVLIGEGGRVEGLVKITDFGISHASGDVTLTQTGQITGTPAFLAPEVAQGTEMTRGQRRLLARRDALHLSRGPAAVRHGGQRPRHAAPGGRRLGPPAAPRRLADRSRSWPMLAADPADPADDGRRSATGWPSWPPGGTATPTTVLLARTDLRPIPGRSHTASLPVEPLPASAPPTPTPTPPPPPAPRPTAPRTLAGAPPAPTPVEQPAPAEEAAEPADAPRSRRRLPLLVAGLVLLLAMGSGVAWLAASSGGDDGTSADPPASSSAPASTDGEQSTAPPPTSAAAQSSEATTVPPASTDPATEVEQLLDLYYRLLPGDTRTAYSLTGPSLRSRVSYQSYAGFWSTWSEVSLLDVRDVSVEGGRITATTDVEFTRPGETQDETHAVTFVRGEDGKLLVDLDVLA